MSHITHIGKQISFLNQDEIKIKSAVIVRSENFQHSNILLSYLYFYFLAQVTKTPSTHVYVHTSWLAECEKLSAQGVLF